MRSTSGAYFGLKLIVVNYPHNNKLYDCVFFLNVSVIAVLYFATVPYQ